MADPTSPQVESGRDGLKACPFCGGEAHAFTNGIVACEECGITAHNSYVDTCIDRWQRRAPHPATALLAECAEVMRDTITALVDAGAWEEATRLDAFIERIGRVE